MNAPALPGPLNDNPSLDRWVSFPHSSMVLAGESVRVA